MTATEPTPDDFIRQMGDRLAYFQARATTEKGAAALAEFERELSKMKVIVARARGEAVDAGAPARSTVAAPVGAALLVSED